MISVSKPSYEQLSVAGDAAFPFTQVNGHSSIGRHGGSLSGTRYIVRTGVGLPGTLDWTLGELVGWTGIRESGHEISGKLGRVCQ